MLYRKIGNSGLYVSVIGLGEWLTFGGQVDEECTLRCMKQAYDLGVNFFDTAEKPPGDCPRSCRQEIWLEKKRPSDQRKGGVFDNVQKVSQNHEISLTATGESTINGYGLSRKHVIEATLASLERLNLDYVDIICAHRPDQLTPMEETVRAFNYLIDKGFALYWGTSMWSADEIAEACGIASSLGLIGPIVEQPVYNLLDRHKVEKECRGMYSRYGIGLAVGSPLKSGILTGGCHNVSSRPPNEMQFSESQDSYKMLNVEERHCAHENMAYLRKIERLKVGLEIQVLYMSSLKFTNNGRILLAHLEQSRSKIVASGTRLVSEE
ncbi:hypothetical protein PRK78_005768 [Emydomyces testavorans]|uniref:NADP-dependent oxidoreductase domain-containing protein n=1 Tax=Emydomyces testavorans TaxID=2070801 RepID=A0AAF0IKC2_9EURO|nr:hypothetical protein PRK78_005768 [Emydomyces testavorans]